MTFSNFLPGIFKESALLFECNTLVHCLCDWWKSVFEDSELNALWYVCRKGKKSKATKGKKKANNDEDDDSSDNEESREETQIGKVRCF